MKKDRYERQRLVLEFGDAAQDSLRKKHVVIIGGGGLGSHSAELMVRMGVGSVTVIDADVVHVTNLHRTSVFTEQDVDMPKALVLKERLSRVNSDVTIRGISQKVTQENIVDFVNHADIILDGTDNLETRFLINETAITQNIPWVYAGVYGTIGMVLGIIPRKTSCLACMTQSIPEKKGVNPVLGNLPVVIASLQCTEALKIMLEKPLGGFIIYDLWLQRFERIPIDKNKHCRCCSPNNSSQSGMG